MQPVEMRVFFSSEEIQKAVGHLANQLNQEYRDKEPVFLVVMNGAFVFAADLLRRFKPPCSLAFVQISSYVGTQRGQGLQTSVLPDLHQCDVVILEDIVDSGHTLAWLKEKVWQQNPRSLKTVAMLNKQVPHLAEADVYALEIPDVFVIGYGLDIDGKYRNLPDICEVVLPAGS